MESATPRRGRPPLAVPSVKVDARLPTPVYDAIAARSLATGEPVARLIRQTLTRAFVPVKKSAGP